LERRGWGWLIIRLKAKIKIRLLTICVKEWLGLVDFNAKNKDLCPIFGDFCARKWRERVAAYTQILRNAL
jgi:hypothetical protein